jgi:histidinol-phosphate aminotransferase
MIKPRESLLEVTPYPLPEEGRRDKIRMDLNENNWGCSPKVVEAIRKASPSDISVYPEYDSLLKKISEFLGVSPENILLTNGSDGAIKCIMNTYVIEGDEVLMPVPTFGIFPQHCKLQEARVVEVYYRPDLSFPLEEVLGALKDRTRMIVIVSPNSPTGTSIDGDALENILAAAGSSVVVLDEAYATYARRSHVPLVKKYPNLIVLQTFSKAYGLAGLRIGYAVSAPVNITNMKKVSLPFSVNSLALMAVTAALDDKDHIDRMLSEIEEEKTYLCGELSAMGIPVRETDANFILAHLGDRSDFVCEKLGERGILVKNLKQRPLEGTLRITLGRREQNRALVETLKEILPPEAILFDVDGVLVDDSASYRTAIRMTAQHFLREEISPDEIQRFKDRGGYNDDWDLTEALIGSRGKSVPREEIVETFQLFYRGVDFSGTIANEKWLLRPGILDELKKRCKLGIVTGRPREEAEYVLRRFGAEKYFDVIVAIEDTRGKGKPDPAGIRMALEKLGVRRALYLGDNVDDIRAARAAGVVPIGVIGTSGTEEEQRMLLSREGAERILGSVNDIVGVLK